MSQAAIMGSASRVQRRKERVLAAILKAAEQQFLEHGYAGTTLEAVARAADVGVGTIYSYFDGKDDLFLAVIDRTLDVLESYQAAAFDPALAPRRQLIVLGETYLRFAREHPRRFRILSLRERDVAPIEEHSRTAQRKAQLDTRVVGMIDRIAAMVQRIVQEGDTEQLDARLIANFLWGAWNGVISLYLQDDARQFDTVAAEAALVQGRRLLVAGLEALLAGKTYAEW